jgi:HD-like signal output (HDOD) protein
VSQKAEYLEPSRPEAASTTLDRDAIIASIGELSVTPRVMRVLSVLLKNSDSDLTPAITAIKTEPVLTAALIAACNCPTHYRGSKLSTLEGAVLRLGLRETYRISLLITFRQGLRISNLPDNGVADYLWSRAVTAACAMELLSTSAETSATAYTIGLLHLIGTFIIARSGGTLEGWDSTHPSVLMKAQEAAHGIAFPEAGAVALKQWEFPAEIYEPIRCQLAPQQAKEFSEYAVMLARANSIAQFVEECRPGSPAYRESATADVYVNQFVQEVELRAVELMETFYPLQPRRPKWARRE